MSKCKCAEEAEDEIRGEYQSKIEDMMDDLKNKLVFARNDMDVETSPSIKNEWVGHIRALEYAIGYLQANFDLQ